MRAKLSVTLCGASLLLAVGRNFILADGSRLFLSEGSAVPGGAPDTEKK